MEQFVHDHLDQLNALKIPSVLYPVLLDHLERATFGHEHVSVEQCNLSTLKWTQAGTLLVIPHICEWNVAQEDSLWQALSTQVSLETLRLVYKSLNEAQLRQPFHRRQYHRRVEEINNTNAKNRESGGLWDEKDERIWLQNQICAHPQTWPRICLYHVTGRPGVRAALPAPPYFMASNLISVEQETEQENILTGPFPFFYHSRRVGPEDDGDGRPTVIPTFLAHWTGPPPTEPTDLAALLQVDLVSEFACPNILVRAWRFLANFGLDDDNTPLEYVMELKTFYTQFVQQMHIIRQNKLQRQEEDEENKQETCTLIAANDPPGKLWKVYTDADDPMEFAHPESGLDTNIYQLVQDVHDADIIFSFQSLFSPHCSIYNSNQRSVGDNGPLINQFPYEGAWVQKDHLARGIMEQHGLPLPNWALESFDLDVQLPHFVAMASFQTDAVSDAGLWIIKPAHGTQSRGHVVTNSLAHVLKLLDAGKPPSRVAQRYVTNPVTFQGRKVDCRCLVVLRQAVHPTVLFLHRRVYFRIAHRRHNVATPRDWVDPRVVLTATHLFAQNLVDEGHQNDPIETLPVDRTTIANLESEYPGEFDWQNGIWPKIQILVRELMDGMTYAHADQLEKHGSFSRAVYGIDIMFERMENEHGRSVIEPKLTEVTFCPANNAICNAYERDDQLYRSYNTELLDCMFRGIVSDNWVRL